MQAFMNEDVALPDGMMAIQVTSSPPSRSGSCLSAVELGKRLLLHSRDGDTDEVKNLISRGAPFTTDWCYRKMQAFMNEDVALPDGMMAIQVTSSPPSRSGSCLSAVELGKRLLLHSRDGDTDEVKNLISRGAPFTTDWLGTSPLHLAALNGHAETAEVLLRGGISRDARTKVDRTPLHIAAQEGHADIVDLLLSHGAEIESLDMLRMTPLHWAVDRGHTNTVMKLLEHGANPNAVSKFEKTPFVIAIDNNRADLVDMLQNTAVYNTASKDSEEHIENPADEADTAAENLMVISGGATEDDEMEEMESDQSELNVITMGTQNCSSAWSGLTDAESNQYEVVPEAIKINFLNSSDKIKTKAKLKPIVVPGTSTSTAQNSIQFLKAHGITMLPADDSNIVTSAMESGQTVVLTEAGKLALNLTRGIPKNSKKAIASIASSSSKGKRKVVTISAEQLAMLTGTSAKVVPINKQLSFSPARLKVKRINEVPNSSKIITTTTGKRVFPSSSQVIGKVVSEPQVMNVKLEERLEEFIVDTLEDEEEQDTLDDRPTDDLETMERKLAQAKKEAEEYRKQLLQKEQEAEEYLKKLQSLSK